MSSANHSQPMQTYCGRSAMGHPLPCQEVSGWSGVGQKAGPANDGPDRRRCAESRPRAKDTRRPLNPTPPALPIGEPERLTISNRPVLYRHSQPISA